MAEALPANGKNTWWIIGTLTTIVLAGSSGFLGSVYHQVRQHGENIAVMQSQMQDTRIELHEIHRKLDQLLLKKGP